MSAAAKLQSEVQERPMLFSGAMVRAILEGRKTQTRRLVAGQASTAGREHFPMAGLHWENDADVLADWREFLRCPHGAPGDRLWVRETWARGERVYPHDAAIYRATVNVDDDLLRREDPDFRWRPSIHMPRWASRLTLELTDVRAERLCSISEDDARAEGVEAHDDDGATYYGPFNKGHASAKVAFSWLWDSINGEGAWAANPWVWVLGFRRLP